MADFHIAMRNRLRMTEYDRPSSGRGESIEHLVVEQRGDYLVISDAEPIEGTAGVTLDTLRPRNSMVGLYMRPYLDAELFLLVSTLPPGLDLPGAFFPVEGVALVRAGDRGMLLSAAGRHDHSAQGGGRAGWHFEASEF